MGNSSQITSASRKTQYVTSPLLTRPFRLLKTWLPLVVIFIAGAYLRLYHIGSAPPGLYYDEGAYGLDALRVLRGEFHLYFAANNGREGLFMYLLALGIAAFGRTPEALRIVSACVGIATLIAIYFAGRNLFSHRIGVLSAGILAITFWHVAISRVTFRAITLPLLLCTFAAFAAYAFKSDELSVRGTGGHVRRTLAYFLSGVACGLTFYTYTSGQFLLWLVVAFGMIEFAIALLNKTLQPSDKLRTQSLISILHSPFLFALLGAALTLAPFILWLTRHSDLYFARVGQVSILSPTINHGNLLGTLLGNIGKAAGMFFIEGDRIWRHNLTLRPVFEGGLALAFMVGVGVLVVASVRVQVANQRAQRFLLLWLLVFLVPTILAEDTPHFLRGIGALPAACLVCAVGLAWALGQLSRRGVFMVFGKLTRLVSPPALMAAILITLSGIKTYNDYFTLYVNEPLTGYWLDQHNVALANTINSFVAQRPEGSVLVQEHLAQSNATLKFLSPTVDQGRAFLLTDAPTSTQAMQPMQWKPQNANYWLLIVDPNRDWSTIKNALPANSVIKISEGALAQGDLDPKPHRAFIAIELTQRLSQGLDRARFEKGIRLNFADQRCNPQAPEDCAVALTWRAEQPITQDYAVFVHWMRAGQLVAQHDSSPGAGYWPMNIWRNGDVVADEFALHVPGGGKPFDEVRVGIYDRNTGTRLNVLDANGNVTGDSVIISTSR